MENEENNKTHDLPLVHELPDGQFFKDAISFDARIIIPARYAEGLSQTSFFALPDKRHAIKTWILNLLNSYMLGFGVKIEPRE